MPPSPVAVTPRIRGNKETVNEENIGMSSGRAVYVGGRQGVVLKIVSAGTDWRVMGLGRFSDV